MNDIKCFFELSWEVCNKVGGIYTVLKSKTPIIMEKHKNIFMIGPFIPQKANIEFQQEPPTEELKETFDELKKEGIECYYGKWLIKGKPQTILIDYSRFIADKDRIKGHLWEKFKVDSLFSAQDFDGPLVWGWAAGKLIEKLQQKWGCSGLVVQGHEWLSGSALLYLKDKNVNVGSVFTTHATVLGRSLSSSGRALYDILKDIDPDEEAREMGVQAKHTLEKATAKNCDVFTTVSDITSLEAKYLLGREADIILPNGLDFSRFPDLEEIPKKHSVNKDRINEFMIPYFFPYQTFDLEKTLFVYISGRYEFKNKGLDIFIDALGILNKRFKEEKIDITIISFIFVPAKVKTPKLEIMESKNLFEDIEDSVDSYWPDLRNKILHSFACKKMPSSKELFDEDFLFDFKKGMISFKRDGSPPLSTHNLQYEDSDQIMRSIRKNGLLNRSSDRVKIVYYPSYLSSSDGLLDMNYYSAIWGCHLGVFPSYYEPWGYTPLESAAYGVPSITTDLSGFGLYLMKRLKGKEPGVYILKMLDRKHKDIVDDLSKKMYDYLTLPKGGRIREKIAAEHFVRALDWRNLADNYIKAHKLAASRSGDR